MKSNEIKFDKRVLDQAAVYQYRNLPISIIGSALIPIVMSIIFWPHVAKLPLIIWLSVSIAVSVIRMILYFVFMARQDRINPQQWADYHAITSLLTGITWGCAIWLFLVKSSVMLQVCLILGVFGLSSATIAANAYWLKSTMFLIVPVNVIGSLRFLLDQDFDYNILAVVMLVYMSMVTLFAYNTNRSLLRTIQLQLNYLDLSNEYHKQKEVAEEANIAKSKFLAAASHDLRQPLHALSLFVGVLDDRIEDPKNRGTLDNIKRSVAVLEDLFSALLDISKLDAQVVIPKQSDFSLTKVLNGLAQEYSRLANDKGLQLNLSCNNSYVRTDPVLLERVLRNLLSNAIRYTENGQIDITCRGNQHFVTVFISDSGIGIPEDQRENVFKEFYQIGNPERDRKKGLGLGLAIVDRLIKLLQLKLTLESAPGEGTVFSLEIPVGDSNAITQPEIKDVTLYGDFSDLLIVVIDDEREIQIGMEELLTDWGCDVVVGADAEEVLDQLEKTTRRPSAIIADYRLRDNKTGTEAIQEIEQKIKLSIPALIVTGDTAIDRLKAAKSSAELVMHKPVKPANLKAFLRSVVRGTKISI